MAPQKKMLAAQLVALASAALMAVGMSTASAAPGGSSTDGGNGVGAGGVAAHRVADAAAAQAADYWTPERMRNAIPGDVLAKKALARGVHSSDAVVEKAAPLRVKGKGKRALHQDETPVSHIGKVFFTMGGSNYVCSGNAVASTNESTVSTAGHCLNEGPGAFVTNFVFVPAYLDGAAPYGKWSATSLYAPTQWSSNGDMAYDTGFAVVAPLGGATLTDTVGSTGVQFNAARGLTYKAFGYPAATPFDGQSLVSCTGATTNDPYNPQFNSQGIPCDMTGGSSGGPWFIGTSSEGYQNSVNSYGYGSRSATMYGPYWGSVIQNTYQTASTK